MTVILSLLFTSSLAAQDTSPPGVELIVVSGEPVPPDVEFPYLRIHWCDDQSLNAGSRWIIVNGVDRTATFGYGGTIGCAGAVKAASATKTVPFVMGANTIQAHICDNAANCTTQDWIVYRGDPPPPPPPPPAPIVTLRAHNADNRDRSLCLTSGAGEAAAWQCGDLLVSHAMPGYATMGRERSLSLLYTSIQGRPRPVLVAAVTQPSGASPTTVVVKVLVNGVPRDSASYTGWGSAPMTRQVAIAYDAVGDSSGIYPVTLLVRNQYAAGPAEVAIDDTVIVVNRALSEFGTGWRLGGVEQLSLAQPGNKVLWIGGDGSAKVYRNVGTNVWQGAAGGFRDTLRYDPGTTQYTRTLRHGIQVVFDATGRHIRTVNRVGQTTTFTWTGSPVRLTSIQVPPGVAGTTYTLVYDAAGKLDRMTDPAGRILEATVVSSRLMSLMDPDSYTTGFAYDAAGRMTGRTTRRGYTAKFVYAKGLRVDTVKVPLNPAIGDTARVAFAPWDEQGLAVGPTGQVAVDTALVNTKIFGPRHNVADDATFWVDRWGAPIRIVDPLAVTTTVVRGDPVVPALVTQVTYHDGRIARMTWDARGNLVQTRDSTSHLADGQPTSAMRWTYLSPNTKDAPDSVIDPEGIVSRYTYNSWGLVSDAIAPNGHVTHVDFVTSGPLAGLVRAVTEQLVPAWDTVSKTEQVVHARSAFAFNTLGNVTSDTSPAGRVRTYTRDAVQRVSNSYDPAGHRVEMVYDPLNRLLQSIQHVEGVDSGFATPLVTRQHYNIDVLDSIIDPRGVIRRYQYDAANRRTAEIDDFGHVEATFYNRGGLVDSIRPRFYEGTSGLVIRHHYDVAGRLLKKAWPTRELLLADSLVYTYDIMSRMLTATQTSRRIVRTYYATGAVKSEVQSTAAGEGAITMSYAYDRAGRRTWYRNGTPGSLFFSDSIWYRYEGTNGELQWIGVRWRQPDPGVPALKDSVRFQWDALGRRDFVTYKNGLVVKFAYDVDGMLRLVCGNHDGGPTSYDVFDFTNYHGTVDGDGMIRATTNWSSGISGCGQNNTLLNTYVQTYDSRHQLRTQAVNGTTTSYVYDGSGNIVRQRKYVGQTTLEDHWMYVAPGHNRLDSLRWGAQATSGRNFIYDVEGARIDEIPWLSGQPGYNQPGRRWYWYDALGRTTGTSEYVCITGNCLWNDTPTACKYDPVGRLFDACQNGAPLLGYDGENAAHTSLDQTTYAWSFVHGPGLDDPIIGYRPANGVDNSKYWYWVTDGQGRQFAVGDATGNDMSGDNMYTHNGGKYAGGSRNANSFGIERHGNPEMYKLSFFRNRFYDQQTGRWTQEDPIGVAGGVNLYAYVGNNPAMFTDPFGLCPLCDALKAAVGRVIDKLTGGGLAAVDVARDVQPNTTRNDVTNAALTFDPKGVSLTGTLTVPFPPAASSVSVTCCADGQVSGSVSPGLALALTADASYVKPGATPDVAVGFYGGEGAYLGGGVMFQGPRPVGVTTSVGVGMGFKSAQPWQAELFSIPFPR